MSTSLGSESPLASAGTLTTGDICDAVLLFGRIKKYAKTGSFGEHIFAHVAKARGHRVELMHRLRIDFMVDGIPVDVKTPPTRMGDVLLPYAPWSGSRVQGVTYAQVEVTQEGVRVTWEGHFSEVLAWSSISDAAQAWANKDGLDLANAKEREENDAAWEVVRADLVSFFADRGIGCEAIYRSVQHIFKDESPANLVLKNYRAGDLRVFVSYSRFVREDAMSYVIAFPCEDGKSLPMRPSHKNKLGIAKVDIGALPEVYRFTSLDDLRLNYSRLAI